MPRKVQTPNTRQLRQAEQDRRFIDRGRPGRLSKQSPDQGPVPFEYAAGGAVGHPARDKASRREIRMGVSDEPGSPGYPAGPGGGTTDADRGASSHRDTVRERDPGRGRRGGGTVRRRTEQKGTGTITGRRRGSTVKRKRARTGGARKATVKSKLKR